MQTDRAASLTTSERKRRNDDERLAYLARVAAMYFEESRTQQEIARALGISRSGVSRLLTEARERGVVEIVIHHPLPRARELERALTARFGLKEARVLAGGDDGYEATLRRLGRLAARYFEDRVHDGMTIGISWGGALYEMIREIRPRDYTNVEVVQLIGATGAEATPTSGPILAQLLAERLRCRSYQLHAPLIVADETARRALLEERHIRETLERARRADLALVGIGTTRQGYYSLVRAGYLSEEDATRIRQSGAVGDVCAQHYDFDGRWLDIELNRRVIGIDHEALRNIDTVIGVAGGSVKAQAIYGALKGGYVNVLITDEAAARRVLALGR
ncbi:sugar-binding transcriptional regulator [Oceanithermus sp.]|uniref:sugar-binding transcriptional regulator n=1 Tax=Oceanithermus sp. TaxID=2268145 RepID=UPI0025F77883|nr:sugar-binding transcriptional regulator [Oceanithermus sp.]